MSYASSAPWRERVAESPIGEVLQLIDAGDAATGSAFEAEVISYVDTYLRLTALDLAVLANCPPLIADLLEQGAALEGPDDSWSTPAMSAAASGSLAALDELLAHGADPLATRGLSEFPSVAESLAAYGDVARLSRIVATHPDVLPAFEPALAAAVRKNRLGASRLLIEAGVEPTLEVSLALVEGGPTDQAVVELLRSTWDGKSLSTTPAAIAQLEALCDPSVDLGSTERYDLVREMAALTNGTTGC